MTFQKLLHQDNASDFVAGVHAHDPHALRSTAENGDAFEFGFDDLAFAGNRNN